jgi:hypothetical protein
MPTPPRAAHYNPGVAAARAVATLALALLPLPGCVEHRFLIRTEPDGARVSVNGVPAGVTPVEIPFDHYGKVRLEVEPFDEDGNGFADWRRMVAAEDLGAPWYQWFPLDFFSDNLWPWTVEDRHEVTLRLVRAVDPDRLTDEQRLALEEEAKGLRERAGKARSEAESEAPPLPAPPPPPAPPPGGGGK